MRELQEQWDIDEDISVLNLSARNIRACEAEALGIMLRASLSITSVDCSLNAKLGDEGVGFLVPALRTDGTGISTIRMLSLMRCGIGDAGEEIRVTTTEFVCTAVATSFTASRKWSEHGVAMLRATLYARLSARFRLALWSIVL